MSISNIAAKIIGAGALAVTGYEIAAISKVEAKRETAVDRYRFVD